MPHYKSNQIKFISRKPKYIITQTKTIQLVSYWARNVIKRQWYLPTKKKTTICSNRYRQRKHPIGK